MDSARIRRIVNEHDLPGYREAQLQTVFFRQHCSSYDEIHTFPKSLRDGLAKDESVLTVSVHNQFTSKSKRAFKALLRLADGSLIETVLLSPKPGLWSCCISSQVGCALGCTFCATGQMGFTRNLTSEEITDQVLFWRLSDVLKSREARLTNVVYMGMGEPFSNKTEVFKSLRELMCPHTFAIGARHISVSTVGIVPVIHEFADDFPQVNLAISLHAPNNPLRRRLMPVNKPFPLEKLKSAMSYYLDKTNRKLFVEYILMNDENDDPTTADELAEFLFSLEKNHLIHVNLILYNKTGNDHCESSRKNAQQFKKHLLAKGVSTTIRKNIGRDINGACGQLALQEPVIERGHSRSPNDLKCE